MDPGETVNDVGDWIYVTQDRDDSRYFVNTVMNIWLPKIMGNFFAT
jgi:hypothetical protein